MSEALDKAKMALAHMAEMDIDLDAATMPKKWTRLLDLAMIQAQVAQAEALERLADAKQ